MFRSKHSRPKCVPCRGHSNTPARSTANNIKILLQKGAKPCSTSHAWVSMRETTRMLEQYFSAGLCLCTSVVHSVDSQDASSFSPKAALASFHVYHSCYVVFARSERRRWFVHKQVLAIVCILSLIAVLIYDRWEACNKRSPTASSPGQPPTTSSRCINMLL